MSDDVNWNDENENVVQHSVQGVAAYVNACNLITIRQERAWDEEQDTIMVMTVDGARRLAERLKDLINSYQM
jgi:hypothetical protein